MMSVTPETIERLFSASEDGKIAVHLGAGICRAKMKVNERACAYPNGACETSPAIRDDRPRSGRLVESDVENAFVNTTVQVTRRMLILMASPSADAMELVDALRQKGVTFDVVCDEPSVMAELASGDVCAVIVYEPQHVEYLQALVAAIGRFYPQVQCSGFEPANATRRAHLFALSEDAAPAPASRKNVDAPANHDPPAMDIDEMEPIFSLSPEELDMLLGREPVDE